MNKTFISISILAISLTSAQINNESLKREFEKQRIENNKKFDAYVAKRYGSSRDPKVLKEIEDHRSNLAGFIENKPYFYKYNDEFQNRNSNTDFLQNGTVTGLTGTFNGENIRYTIFDSGRVFGDHLFFNNANNRVTNHEAATMNYSSHSTSVAGFIGARNFQYSGPIGNTNVNVNAKGVAPNSTMDSYSFLTTTLPGSTTSSTVYQKILTAQPAISNHSYGTTMGWSNETINGVSSWLWNGSFASPNIYADAQGSYFNQDRNYDKIVYDNPDYIIVKAAGNEYGGGPTGDPTPPRYYQNANGDRVAFATTDTLPPNNCSQGYDCISIGSLAKNIIVVGATDIITTNGGRYTNSTDVIHSSYSSAGPRDDGGIKPDISAVGTQVTSAATAEDTTGSNLITIANGTSYAAPIVTGIIGLWTQINRQLFNNNNLSAASAKTLTIHSASEAGNIGPDPHFGWGFINARKGAEILVGKSNNTIIFNDETLSNGTINTKTVRASGSEPLKVTISWIDPEFTNYTSQFTNLHNNRTSRLINDLDLRITQVGGNNTVYLPWRLDPLNPMTALKGDNTVDNVEQVVIDNPTAGAVYRIDISHKGTLRNNASPAVTGPQNYAIIVTGHNEVLGTKDTNATILNTIAVAPSVTKDMTNILKAPKKSTFNVYDMSGKKLQSGIVNSDKEAIDVSTYTKGVYIIEVKTEKEIITRKIIKE